MVNKTYFRYWGKAKKNQVDSTEPNYHLLVFHSLDVAAVGQLILQRNLFGTDRIIDELTNDKSSFIEWFCFYLAIHDLGKFSGAFQQLKKFRDSDLTVEPSRESYDNVHHSHLGYALWAVKLRKDFRARIKLFTSDSAKILMQIVCGHHGIPATVSQSERRIKCYFNPANISAATEFIEDLDKLFDGVASSPFAELIDTDRAKEKLKSLSWILAGVTTIADWLGSDSEIFGYCSSASQSLSAYWQQAQNNAANLLKKIGYEQTVQVAKNVDFTKLYNVESLRELQQFCATVVIDTGPHLFTLEDYTGSGKTLAALILAHRIMAHGHSSKGIFVGMPTMATADAMYDRVAKIYRNLFTEDKCPSLILAHSAKHLSDTFNQTVHLTEQEDDFEDSEQDKSATVWCNEWFTSSSKKALLADVGVGTIDQALMAVLPVKHQSLRLLGLLNKVLIIDEVHSSSIYQCKLIEKLIEFHVSFGGSVILLSATMSFELRKAMADAYYRGVQQQKPRELNSKVTMPLITHCSETNIAEEDDFAASDTTKEVQVHYFDDVEHVWNIIANALTDGKSVCWIRNTVDQTIESYLEAESRFTENQIDVFHSRYCISDKTAIETKMIHAFGKESSALSRRGRLAIMSPISEQSLDIDFTVMITDVAPIDVLLQRLGRCCRHPRFNNEELVNDIQSPQDQRGIVNFHVMGPVFDINPDKDWLAKDYKPTESVYLDASLIWRTVKILEGNQRFEVTKSARTLIDRVFSQSAVSAMPIVMQELHDIAEQKNGSDAQSGELNRLNVETGYSHENSVKVWGEDYRYPTRLVQENIEFVLLIGERLELQDKVHYKLRFFHQVEHHLLDSNKITVGAYFLTECVPALQCKYAYDLAILKRKFRQFNYVKPLILELDEAGQYVTKGFVKRFYSNSDKQEVTLIYSSTLGLRKSQA